jgi:anti-sigma28 factor (negative regulator of flagellin synthesis)
MAQKSKSASSRKPHLTLSLPLDEQKVAAIQKCLKKGRLTISVSSIETLKPRIRADDGYKYD